MPDSLSTILQNKTSKAKEKVRLLSDLLLNKRISIDEFIKIASLQKDSSKATLIEAMEYSSKTNPGIINERGFQFAIKSLADDAPRVKWEAAKVIDNTAHLFPSLLKKATTNLLINTEHNGTVVRWSAAKALTRIMQLNSSLKMELAPVFEAILKREEDNAIKKIYQQALKKSLG